MPEQCVCVCVCLNATAIFLIQTQSVHQKKIKKKKNRNRETEIDIRKKQSGFYSYCVNLLRPAECYLGIISINTWRKVGACYKVQTIRGKETDRGKAIALCRKIIEQKAKTLRVK